MSSIAATTPSVATVDVRDVFRIHRTAEGDAAALQGLTLTVREGELVCVLGPSGAGKSTLLRIVAGIEPPSAGDVRVAGFDVGRMGPGARAAVRRLQIGFLAERSGATLPPDLTIADCVALPLRVRGAANDVVSARVQELLTASGLENRRGALPHELSGGERQRVALCAAIAHRPALLLADEPTGELDDAGARTVRRAIAELVRDTGLSAIVVSHDPEAANDADRVVRIRDGRVVEDRRSEQDEGLVIGRDGWVRLPSELIARAGIGRRVTVRAEAAGLVVTGIPEPPGGDDAQPATAAASMPSYPQTTVVIRGVRRAFGRRVVLDGLDATFAPGRLTVVTGRSGSGKTTLLRILAGLDRPDAGAVEIDGKALGGDPEALAAIRRGRIGYLAQEPVPIAFLSAVENLELSLTLKGVDRTPARELAAATLAAVGLADRAEQRVERLSAGERQRVALARALAGARGLLIVDEPTSRVDEPTALAIGELLASCGQTVICASHDPLLADRADAVLSL